MTAKCERCSEDQTIPVFHDNGCPLDPPKNPKAASFTPTGWLCPACMSVYAPHVDKCSHCGPKLQISYTGTADDT